ncbi:MAG TPA: GNAT family N-acetyltransferase [Acidimicrobiales bacterium]|nr:GNAT family N-acetyltransferase [Acidimicrobiales bacterium]
MGYQVREARNGDIPGIETAYFRSWRAAYEDFLEPDVLNDQAEWRRHSFDWSRGMKDPTAAVLVAVDLDGVVLGVAQVNEVLDAPRDLPEITMLYVDPRAWGSRIATDLLSAGVDWIADRGHTSARLRVAEDQLRARRFYEREGWTPDLTSNQRRRS